MRMLMVVAMGFAMFVAVSVRVIVSVVFYRERQYFLLSVVTLGCWGFDHVQMPRL